MNFKKTIIISVGLIFISFSFVAKCSQLKNLNNYSVMLCGKVSNNILDDIGGYKERDKKSKKLKFKIKMQMLQQIPQKFKSTLNTTINNFLSLI